MDEAVLIGAAVLRSVLLWLTRGHTPPEFSGGTHVRAEWALESAFLLAKNAALESPVPLPVPLAAVLVRALSRLGVLVCAALVFDVAAGLYLGAFVSRLSSREERVACTSAANAQPPSTPPAQGSTASEGADTRTSASSVLVRATRRRSTAAMVAALYVVLPAVAQGAEPLPSLVRLCILGALFHAVSGDGHVAMAFLAAASHVSLYPAFLLPALAAVLAASTRAPFRRVLATCLAVFAASSAALAYASAVLAGTHWSAPAFSYAQTYAALLAHADVAPGPGAAWYMLAQVFPPFAPVFAVFCTAQHGVHALIVPIRFYRERALHPPCPRCASSFTVDPTAKEGSPAAHAASDRDALLDRGAATAEDSLPAHGDQSTSVPPYARPSVQGTAFAACIATMLSLFLQPQPGAADVVTVVLIAIFAIPRTAARGSCDNHRPQALHSAASFGTPIAAFTALCALASLPTIWRNWTVFGRDSANVFYFATLAIVAAQVVLVVDAVRARTRGRILLLNPTADPSALRQR